jgi:aldose 1-epimerase
VVLGLNRVADYEANSPYFGGLIGPYANRIRPASSLLRARTIRWAREQRARHAARRQTGFDKVVWTVKPIDNSSAELDYVSKDDEMGFPGNSTVKVVYTWTNDDELKIELGHNREAHRRQPHEPFVLQSGARRGRSIEGHLLQIDADNFAPYDATGIPTRASPR